MTADGATEYRYRLMGWGRLTSDATNHSHFLHFCKSKTPMRQCRCWCWCWCWCSRYRYRYRCSRYRYRYPGTAVCFTTCLCISPDLCHCRLSRLPVIALSTVLRLFNSLFYFPPRFRPSPTCKPPPSCPACLSCPPCC